MTRLTVPTAGTDPGRAARAPTLPQPELGNAIEGLGDIAFQVGTKLEGDRLQRDMQRNQIELTRDMNNLRLEVEGIGDPDAAEQAWEQGVEGLRTQYLGGQDAGGRVDPKNADDFALTFDELSYRNAFSLGRRNLGLRQAERRANYLAYSQEASRAGATADPQLRAQLIEQGDEIIAQNLAAGVIDAEEAERQRLALRGDISNARAIAAIDEDPQTFLDEVEAGGFPGLEADTLARYSSQAQGALDRAAEEAAKAAEKAAEDRKRAVDTRLVEIRKIAQTGRGAIDEQFLSSPEAQQSPEYGHTAAALALRDEKVNLSTMTPAELRAKIAEEESRDLAMAWQAERLDILRDALDEAVEGYAADPIAHGAAQGLLADDSVDFDGEPGDVAEALQARAQAGMALVDRGYTDTLAVLTNDERADLKARMAASEDPEARARLAAALAASLPSEGPDTLLGVTGDPVVAHVGMLASATRSSRLGTEILRGQEALARDNIQLPPVAERAGPAFDVVDTVFADIPGGEAYREAATAAADALYARRRGRISPDEDFDKKAYQQALHEVMGGTGQYGASGARGGIQDVRGRQTILPQGLSADAVDQAFDRLGEVITEEGRRRHKRRRFDQDTMLAQLKAASGGHRPLIAGEVPDSRTLSQVQLQAVGNDRYVMVMPVRGDTRPRVILNDQGDEFTFSLRQLVGEVGQ